MKKINIPLSEQVVSREIAPDLNQALDKAGIEVESLYSWYKESSHGVEVCINRELLPPNICFHQKAEHRKKGKGINIFTPYFSGGTWEWEVEFLIPTYTLTELLRVLPEKMTITVTLPADDEFPETIPAMDYTADYYLWLSKHSIVYVDTLGDIVSLQGSRFEINDKINPATAAALLIVWCVENGYLGGGE